MLDVVLAFSISILKIFKWLQSYRYHRLQKTFGKFFRSYSELLSRFGAISFQEYVSEGIPHPVFYGDLVYKLRRVKSETNFISLGSKIVKRLRRRQYFDVGSTCITQWSSKGLLVICFVLVQSCTDHSLSVTRWLTKPLGLYDGPCLNLLRSDRILIPVPSDC